MSLPVPARLRRVLRQRDRLRHAWREGGAGAATFTAWLVIGYAAWAGINPESYTDDSVTQIRLTALTYLALFVFLTVLGAVIEWHHTGPARPSRSRKDDR